MVSGKSSKQPSRLWGPPNRSSFWGSGYPSHLYSKCRFALSSIGIQLIVSLRQLHVHHPELRDAWGDLEAAVRIVDPHKAEQPSGLKVTLLPFQRESLYWMRTQETGKYAGGLLAVSPAHLLE